MSGTCFENNWKSWVQIFLLEAMAWLVFSVFCCHRSQVWVTYTCTCSCTCFFAACAVSQVAQNCCFNYIKLKKKSATCLAIAESILFTIWRNINWGQLASLSTFTCTVVPRSSLTLLYNVQQTNQWTNQNLMQIHASTCSWGIVCENVCMKVMVLTSYLFGYFHHPQTQKLEPNYVTWGLTWELFVSFF